MLFVFGLFAIAFCGIWIGSGIAIKSIERISHGLRISSFAVSFLLLGFFTSLGELSVGVNAILDDDPEIFVGNLIGASIVLFMLVIPLLAIVGKKININKELRGERMILPLVTVAAPVLLSIDGTINKLDGIIALVLFIVTSFFIQKKQGLLEKTSSIFKHKKFSLKLESLKVLIGVALVFGSSYLIVHQTMLLSQIMNWSPFLIGLLFIAVGTNIPEISFVFRSAFMKDSQVVFGDYMGSAATNTLLFGGLSIWYGKPILLTNSYLVSLGFLLIGLIAFFIFAKSKHSISRHEGLLLLGLYGLFLLTEIFSHIT